MVSTRRYFDKGERVLCFEPDPTKAKVLYDSKILGIYETRDKRGKKIVQYKVHFQGWSNSWDRKVNANFVLKDTEDNRQLQRDLAEKAQLQLGAYLYRGIGKKRPRKSLTLNDLASGSSGGGSAFEQSSPKARQRGSGSDCSSGSTYAAHEDYTMKDEFETESCCSSVDGGGPDEERVLLRVSERLREYLEYDYDMVVKLGKRHTLPCRVPIIVILENFVKQSALQLAVSSTQTESSRRRTTQQRTDKKEREFDKLVNTIGLLKEVADGLRIYFDFTIADHLLYTEEKEHALSYLSEDNLKNFSYIATLGLSADLLTPKNETEQSVPPVPQDASSAEPTTTGVAVAAAASNPATDGDEPQKRKLRSYRSDDCDLLLETCLSSMASTSSGASTPLHSNMIGGGANISYLKSLQPMALSIPPQTKDFLQSVLVWRLLPTNAAAAPSMIFGAPHLARLLVKLPDFLNATPTISDEKLKILLQHLDSFTNFLESKKEWFNEDNYMRSAARRKNSTDATRPSPSNTDAQRPTAQAQPEARDVKPIPTV